jgi:hypothetical protein
MKVRCVEVSMLLWLCAMSLATSNRLCVVW